MKTKRFVKPKNPRPPGFDNFSPGRRARLKHTTSKMNYADFLKLVRGGETTNVDFKIDCCAFLSNSFDSDAAKAELVKDVCAMANNGNVASYIVIGVSNDGTGAKSVANPQLTDDNVQSFCKTAISPPIKLRVHHCKWADAQPVHARKHFIVIQVGPNARHAYRLNADFIDIKNNDPKRRFCFRRNEVWIRRGATSDLAAPEEIGRMLRGKPAEGEKQIEGNVDYTKLPREAQKLALAQDFTRCVEEVGGRIVGPAPGRQDDATSLRLVLSLRKEMHLLNCTVLREMKDRFAFLQLLDRLWAYESGFIILLLESPSKRGFPPIPPVHFFDRSWGFFTMFPIGAGYLSHQADELLSLNFKRPNVALLTLPKVTDTTSLRNAFFNLLTFLRKDDDTFGYISKCRAEIIRGIRTCLKEGWIERSRYIYGARRPSRNEFQAGEFLCRKWPGCIVKRKKEPQLALLGKQVLRLTRHTSLK